MRTMQKGAVAGAAMALFSFATAGSASADDASDCMKPGDPLVAACSRAIASGRFKGPQLADFHNAIALASLRAGAFDRAQSEAEKALAADPKSVRGFVNRANSYSGRGDFDRAIPDYTQALTIDPKFAAALVFRGAAYNGKGDFDKALADLNAAIAIDGRNPLSYMYRGGVFAAKRDADKAIADFSQALTIEPKFGPALVGRGDAYRNKGDNDKAMADYTQALAVNPKDAQAFNSRGNAYRSKGEFDKAIADYSQAITVDPSFLFAYVSRSDAYRATGDFDKAIADSTQGIKIEPKAAVFYLFRAKSRWAKGDITGAIADTSEAIKIDPESARNAQFDRGIYEIYAGNVAKAREDLDASFKLDNKDPYTALWLDIANKRAGQPTRLKEVTSEMDMTEWPAPLVRLYLGDNTPEAALKAADDGDPAIKKTQTCEASFYIGELSAQKGQKDEAGKLLRTASTECLKDSNEWAAANAALKALDAKP